MSPWLVLCGGMCVDSPTSKMKADNRLVAKIVVGERAQTFAQTPTTARA